MGEEFRGIYNYIDSSGSQREIEIREFKESLEIDKMSAQTSILESQSDHNRSLTVQTDVQTFMIVLSEIRQALGSIGVDDEKESGKEVNGPTVAIKSAFEEPRERARLKKLYGRTIDAAVRCVCQLDPLPPPDLDDLMFDDEV